MSKQLPSRMESWFYKLGTNNSSQIATAILAGFKTFFIPLATIRDKKATPDQKKYTAARDVITELLAVCLYIGVTGLVQKVATAPICKSYFKKKAKMIESGKIKDVANILTKEELDMLKNVDAKKLHAVGIEELSTGITSEGKYFVKKGKEASVDAKLYVEKLENVVNKVAEKWPKHSKTFKNPDGLKQKIFDAFDSKSKIINPKKAFGQTRINISQISIWVLALTIIPGMCNVIIKPVMQKLNKPKKNAVDAQIKQPEQTVQMTPVANVGTQKGKNVNFGKGYYNNRPSLGNMRVG